jgi:cytochrome oxidase Cu insertion factor (SCO1/SenC/PrrC family)
MADVAKKMTRMLKIISLVILGSMLVFGLVTAGCRPTVTPIPQPEEPSSEVTPTPQPEPSSAEGYEVGDRTPDFELPNLEGQIVSLGELKGKPILLVFWHFMCSTCYEEMPLVQEV